MGTLRADPLILMNPTTLRLHSEFAIGRVDNEMDGPWQLGHVPADQYASRALQAAKMMKDVDGSIELVASGSPARPWIPTWTGTAPCSRPSAGSPTTSVSTTTSATAATTQLHPSRGLRQNREHRPERQGNHRSSHHYLCSQQGSVSTNANSSRVELDVPDPPRTGCAGDSAARSRRLSDASMWPRRRCGGTPRSR